MKRQAGFVPDRRRVKPLGRFPQEASHGEPSLLDRPVFGAPRIADLPKRGGACDNGRYCIS